LSADAPARAIGFASFDFGEAGVYGEARWVARTHE
jgi:hypothetical protein